MEYNVVNFDSC